MADGSRTSGIDAAGSGSAAPSPRAVAAQTIHVINVAMARIARQERLIARMMAYAKLGAVIVTILLYVLVAFATKDAHGLSYGPYPLPVFTALIVLAAIALVVGFYRNQFWMEEPPAPAAGAPAPPAVWSAMHFTVLVVLTLITCRLAHQEISIWRLKRGLNVDNSTFQLHAGGHTMHRAGDRDVVEIHLDGQAKDPLYARFVFHQGD